MAVPTPVRLELGVPQARAAEEGRRHKGAVDRAIPLRVLRDLE